MHADQGEISFGGKICWYWKSGTTCLEIRGRSYAAIFNLIINGIFLNLLSCLPFWSPNLFSSLMILPSLWDFPEMSSLCLQSCFRAIWSFPQYKISLLIAHLPPLNYLYLLPKLQLGIGGQSDWSWVWLMSALENPDWRTALRIQMSGEPPTKFNEKQFQKC